MTSSLRKAIAMVLCLIASVGTGLAAGLPLASAEPSPAIPSPGVPAPPAPIPFAPNPLAPNPINVGQVTTPPIGWTQLGRSDRIDMLGSDQFIDTDIPVPSGVIPDQLVGAINLTVNIGGGRVDVLDGRDVYLGSIPAPADLTSAPFTVDISRAYIVNGIAKLRFVLRDRNPLGNSCSRLPSLTLNQLAATYRGQSPYPAVVADFVPGYLDQVLIRTGPSPTSAAQQAALELVANLTRLYRPIPVRIDIDTSSGPAPPGPPSRRVIELRDVGQPGMTVAKPNSPDATLVITGDGFELSRQVALFYDRRVLLAQTGSALVAKVSRGNPVAATTGKTFAQLGMTGTASVLGTTRLFFGFDASQFQVGSVEQATMHLIAHYSPVISGEASAVVRAGNAVLASRKLDESGLLDITGIIPRESINSTVGIDVELRYRPEQECAPLNERMNFSIDPASTIVVTPGVRNRGGFPVLPMAFTPDFAVVVEKPEYLKFAAESINLLQQQTAVLLQPQLTDLASAAASRKGVLVIGASAELRNSGLTPRFTIGDGNSVDIGGTPQTTVDFGGSVGAVQAFSVDARMVITANATDDWSLVQRCFDYIRSQDSRWASLTGNVVAAGPAGQVVNLTLREGGALLNEYPGEGWKWWGWLTAAVLGIALLGVAGVLLWRRRTHRG